jgi:hypothetical protein
LLCYVNNVIDYKKTVSRLVTCPLQNWNTHNSQKFCSIRRKDTETEENVAKYGISTRLCTL